jgi:hypothetical protein
VTASGSVTIHGRVVGVSAPSSSPTPSDVWSALEHDVVGDGVTDDTAAIKAFLIAAAEAEAVAYFPALDYVSSWFYVPFVPRISGAEGARILCSQTNDSWNFGVSTTPSSVLLTGNAAAGTRTIDVPTSGIAADDVILIGDTATMVGGSSSTLNVPAANLYRVLSIDSASQLTISEPLLYAMTTANSAYVKALPMRRRGWIRGLHFESTAGHGSGVTASFLRLWRIRDLDIDVTADGFSNAGLILQDCYQFRVKARCTDFADVAATGFASQFGYGVDVSGASAHGSVEAHVDRARHAVSLVGTGHDIRVTGVAQDCTSGAWDSHAGFTDVLFHDCITRGGGVASSGGRAYNIRGRRHHVVGGFADQTNGGVYLFDAPRDVTVRGLTVTRTLNGGHGVEVGDAVTNVVVQDNTFDTLAGNGLWVNFTYAFTDLVVQGNRFKDVTGAVVKAQNTGTLTRWRVTDNVVDDTLAATTSFVEIPGATVSDVVVDRNTLPPALVNITGASAASVTRGRRSFVRPSDHGLLAWTYPPDEVTGSSGSLLGTAGTVYLLPVEIDFAGPATNVLMYVTTQGSGLTSGQCFAALFQGGVLIGTTADQATAWGTTGMKTMALASGPFNVSAGPAYVAAFWNGSTAPQFARTGNLSGLINVGIGATASRYGSANTGRTTSMPGTLGTIAAASNAFWAGVS